MSIKNILIINQPVGNRGDESAHKALVRSINKALPDVKITVLAFQDNLNAIDEFVVQNSNNRYLNFIFKHNLCAEPVALYLIKHRLTKLGTMCHPILRKLRKYYKNADIVICAPGGICMGGFQNWKHLYMLQVARDLQKPIVYYSRSIGPFPEVTGENKMFKRISLDMLRSFLFLSLRDSKSKRLADSLGINYVPSIDSAFLDFPKVAVPDDVKMVLKSPYVVFVPNELTWHYAFKDASQQDVDSMYVSLFKSIRRVAKEHTILMLPQLCTWKGKDDYTYFQKLAKMIKDDNIVVMPDTIGSDLQQVIIRGAAFVVGARYHSVVFAINNEVPFVALGYEHKIPGLLEDLSLADRVVDITGAFKDSNSCKRVVENFDRVLNQFYNVKPSRALASNIADKCFYKMLDTIMNVK